jgi:thiamine biosynthesis lipoprotein
MQFSDNFRAMDTEISVFIEASAPPLDGFISTKLLFEQQEQRFSRFRETSLLSRLNRGETISDAWFSQAISLALAACRETGGLFNPMVLQALREAGYSQTFDSLTTGAPRAQAVIAAGDALVIAGESVRLAAGQLDLGGIVKGWTVDVAAQWLNERYADVFVNAGGDLRCTGSEEGGSGWLIDVDGPAGMPAPWKGAIQGAVATSTTLKRRWKTATGGSAHHLIDPRTGLPANSPFVQVTVRAETCWRAEVWAKAVLIGGDEGMRAAAAQKLAVFAIRGDGEVARAGSW